MTGVLRFWREALIALLAGVILVGSLLTCDSSKSGLSDKSQKTDDSLAITKPAFDSVQLRREQEEAAHVAAAAALEATVRQLTVVAARQRAIADSLARAQNWRAAYLAKSIEADTLRSALDSANARAAREQAARMIADEKANEERIRRIAVEGLNESLKRDVANAANCKVPGTFGLIPCATRTQVAIVSAAAGAGAGYLLARK